MAIEFTNPDPPADFIEEDIMVNDGVWFYLISIRYRTKDVIVIRGYGIGLDLEDLAAANVKTAWHKRVCLCVLAVLWIGLTITVAGLKQDTWFLLGAGGIGTLQNILVAALPRKPGPSGIHLKYERTVVKEKVMATLQAIEEIQPFLGRSLLDTFFPGEMREDEIKWWEDAKEEAKVAKPVVVSGS